MQNTRNRLLLTCLTITAMFACHHPAPPTAANAPPAASIASDPSPQKLLDCCRQCLQASARDPAGLDLSLRACTHYRGSWRGETGLDAECTSTLQDSKWTTRGCRELVERTQP